MDILVFSDSHHDTNSMTYVIGEENPDMVLHLGDNVRDALLLKGIFPEIKFEFVSGNCDFEDVADKKIIEIENIRFFMTHGHEYHVKSDISNVVKKGLDEKADIILFGHTHRAYMQKESEAWVINPGSISKIYKMDKHASYAKITIENGEADCRIVERK